MQITVKNIDPKSRIMITGSNGMVGRALKELLSSYDLICASADKLDLCSWHHTNDYISFFKPDYIFHLAAKVGGVKANLEFLGEFYTTNILMNTHVLEAARISGVKKVVSVLSTCIYPDVVKYPLTEDQIHNGPPHSSNYTYAYAKRMLDVQSQAYRDQFGCNFVTVVPNNLYGFFDNFDLENSHVIPAIIRKVYESKQADSEIILWGNGSPLREFTYVPDLAEILLFILDTYNEKDPINVGAPYEVSVRYAAQYICDVLDVDIKKLKWDTDKPSGQFRKPSSNKKFQELLKKNNQQFAYTDIETGLREVCEWFLENYPNIRGIYK